MTTQNLTTPPAETAANTNRANVSQRNTHYDQILTNISVGYSDNKLIADQLFKEVVVEHQSDKYYVWDSQEQFIAQDDTRAPGTVASEVNWKFSRDSYYATGHAIRAAIADEEYENADSEFDLEAQATRLVTSKILLNKELDLASKLTNRNNFDGRLGATLGAAGESAQWSDYTNSDPQKDILVARQTGDMLAGMDYNTLVLSKAVYNVLRLHPKLKAFFGTITPTQFVSIEQMKMLFEVENIIIAEGRVASRGNDVIGNGTAYIWGTNAVLCYVPSSAGKYTPAVGYTFSWNKRGNVSGAVKVRKYYNEESQTTFIEGERWYDQKIISAFGAYVFNNAVNPLVASVTE